MILRILLITVLLAISSCKWFSGASWPYMSGVSFDIPEDASPTFKKGYRDGCSQILYSRGNMFYRFKHQYQYDVKMNNNPEYRLGYKRGISFCFNSITPGVYSFDRMLFFHKDPLLAGNYNDTGGGLFGGVESPVPAAEWGGLDGVVRGWSGTGGNSSMGANPLWAGGSSGQFFGQE